MSQNATHELWNIVLWFISPVHFFLEKPHQIYTIIYNSFITFNPFYPVTNLIPSGLNLKQRPVQNSISPPPSRCNFFTFDAKMMIYVHPPYIESNLFPEATICWRSQSSSRHAKSRPKNPSRFSNTRTEKEKLAASCAERRRPNRPNFLFLYRLVMI